MMSLLLKSDRGPSPASRAPYLAIVMRVAGGDAVTEEEVAEVLETRTVEQFEADTSTARDRLAAAARRSELSAVRENIAELEADRAKIQEESNRMRAKIDALIGQLMEIDGRSMAKYEAIRALKFEMDHIEQQTHALLMKTACLSIDERLREKQGELNRIQIDLSRKQQGLAEYRAAIVKLEELERRSQRLKSQGAPRDLQELAGLTAQLLVARATVAAGEKLVEEIAAAEAQLRRLEAEKLGDSRGKVFAGADATERREWARSRQLVETAIKGDRNGASKHTRRSRPGRR